MQSTHSFSRVQTEYFLLHRKSSELILHFKSKYCLVVQHRKHGTETKGDTGIPAHCIPLEKCPVSSFFFFLPYFYFPYFLSGLNIANQINPYIQRNLENISIQAFHFFKLQNSTGYSTRKEIAKQHKYINARQYYLSFPGRISVFLKIASVELVLYRMIFGIKYEINKRKNKLTIKHNKQ